MFSVYFKQGYSKVDTTYLNNNDAVDSIFYKINHGRIKDIYVYAYASPEGQYSKNKALAEKRAQEICDLFNFENVTFKTVDEDWDEIEMHLVDSYVGKHREKVLNIIRTVEGNDKRKQLIKNIDKCKTYNEIISLYAKYSRKADIIFIYEPGVEEAEVVKAKPQFEYIPRLNLCILKDITIDYVDTNKLVLKSFIQHEAEIKECKHWFSVKTNLLYDIGTFINYSIEVPMFKHYSVVINHVCPWWLTKNNIFCNQTLILGGDIKYWFNEYSESRVFTGHSIGLYTLSGKSDLQWKTSLCYQSKFYSIGLTYTYAISLNKYINLEFSIGAGFANIKYQHYKPSIDYSILYRDIDKVGELNYFGLTRAEINLVIPIIIKTN